MEKESNSNLYPCAHCKETGTCSSATNGDSCSLCIKKNELIGDKFTGLACSICGGLGKAEPLTERINKRITPMLSLFIVIPLLAIVWFALATNNQHFSEILAFSSALIGTVIGFYFSNKN